MTLTIGSLCTGYGGLDMAVQNKIDARLVWCAESEKYPSQLLAQRFPGLANFGDITQIDWNYMKLNFPVDILTGGYPCQPFSGAGLRQGENDERHLWPFIREAIRILRPRVALLENVAGHRSLGFSDVLRDCAEDGKDVRWISVRASDAGAPHGRERLFFAVTDTDGPGLQGDQFLPGRPEQTDQCSGAALLPVLGRSDAISWGEFEPSIRQWQRIIGRTPPAPTEPNKFGRPRLTAEFHEWMMGLPKGWVTDVKMPYGAKISMTGSGVVIQQAEIAVYHLLMAV